MAAHTTYVIRRVTTFVFRRRVPALAKNFYAKPFFCFSLRTHLISEARRRAAVAARFTDDLIGLIEMCGADMLDDRQLDGMVDDLMRFEVAASEALRETCGPRGPDAVAAAIRLHEATRETMRAALVYNDYDAIAAPLGRTLDRLGLPLETASEDWSRAARRAARALIEVADENILREQGIYRTDAQLASTFRCAPDRATHGLSPVVQHGLPPAPSAPSAASSAAQPSRAIPTPTAQPAHAPSPNEPCRPTLIQQVQHAGANMQPAPATNEIPAARHVPNRTPVRSRAASNAPTAPVLAPDALEAPQTAEKKFSAWFQDAMDLKEEENPGL